MSISKAGRELFNLIGDTENRETINKLIQFTTDPKEKEILNKFFNLAIELNDHRTELLLENERAVINLWSLINRVLKVKMAEEHELYKRNQPRIITEKEYKKIKKQYIQDKLEEGRDKVNNIYEALEIGRAYYLELLETHKRRKNPLKDLYLSERNGKIEAGKEDTLLFYEMSIDYLERTKQTELLSLQLEERIKAMNKTVSFKYLYDHNLYGIKKEIENDKKIFNNELGAAVLTDNKTKIYKQEEGFLEEYTLEKINNLKTKQDAKEEINSVLISIKSIKAYNTMLEMIAKRYDIENILEFTVNYDSNFFERKLIVYNSLTDFLIDSFLNQTNLFKISRKRKLDIIKDVFVKVDIERTNISESLKEKLREALEDAEEVIEIDVFKWMRKLRTF